MYQDKQQRKFFNAPQSVESFVAAFMEPGIAVLVYLLVNRHFDEPLARAGQTLCLLIFALSFPARNRFHEHPMNALLGIVGSWLGLLAVLYLCAFASDSLRYFHEEALLWWGLIAPGVQGLAVEVGRRLLRWRQKRSAARRTAVVVGAGASAVRVSRALSSSARSGVSFLGYFDDRHDDRLHAESATRLLGPLSATGEYVRQHAVHEVYIMLPLGSQPRIVQLLEELQGTTASLFFVPDVFGISIIQGRLSDVNGVPVVGLCETPFTGVNAVSKRISDIVLATLILILISPILLMLAAAVKLSSPGPAIFRQRRNGLDGEEIVVYKFRSMRVQEDGAVVRQATQDDPRITRLGAFMRRTSLDELPQFINVLQGRMSVVGPRPHAVAHNEEYRQLIKAYMVRHKVRPGITGWAQVNGLRGETRTVDMMKLRVEYDLEYLRNWSIGLDLQILARTVRLVLFDRNAF